MQPAQLQQEVEKALELRKAAFLRKHHWTLHFAMALGGRCFLPSCWATERKHKLITRCASATTNLTAFDRIILEECLSHDLLNLQSSTSFMVGAGLLSPHPATKKAHAFACMCLQEANLPAAGSTQASLFARLGSCGSCKAKDFALVQCDASPAAFRAVWHLLYNSLLLFFDGIDKIDGRVMQRSVAEEWCRAVLGKSGVETCWGRVVWRSAGEEWCREVFKRRRAECREVWGKSGVEQCWGRVVYSSVQESGVEKCWGRVVYRSVWGEWCRAAEWCREVLLGKSGVEQC